jgi:hypothetical protein
MIIISFIAFVLLKYNAPHNAPGSTAASEQFELGETLLWQNIKAIQRYPTTMG